MARKRTTLMILPGRIERQIFMMRGQRVMLSSVIQSPIAVKVNIEIMRAFVRLRQLFSAPGDLVAQITKLAKAVELHDDQIKTIMDVLEKMLKSPEPAGPKSFGFAQQ